VTVLGGAPGVGKMALALTYVRQAALVNGVATAIFSTAVTGEVLLLRLLAAETRTPLEQFTKQGLDVQQTAAVHQAWQKLNAAPLRINDSPELGATELRRSLVVLLRQAEVHLVVVISHTGHPVRHLTDVAREFHVALMLVCRSSGLTDDFADREQNSERILVLQRPGLANGAEVVVLRNRFGPTGRVKLTFNSDYMGFEDAHVRP
jgi:replicative DNA helicase